MVDKPPAVLIGDALALDFLNTHVAFPTGPVDYLDSGEALLSWMLLVKLIDPGEADKLRSASPPDDLDAVAAETRELRDWFHAFVNRRQGQRLTSDALAASSRLNGLLEAEASFNTIVAGDDEYGPPLRLRSMRRRQSPRSLLTTLAEALARFLCDETLVNVKTCSGPGCRLMFADYTRDGSRRWCSMAMCGSPTWQATHAGASSGRASGGPA